MPPLMRGIRTFEGAFVPKVGGIFGGQKICSL
jgi:hypothetical protein